MKKILVIDPASSTGYAVAEVEGDKARIYRYGFIDVDTTSQYMGDWCIDLMAKVKDIMIKENIDDLAIEDFFFSGKFASGCSVNTAFRTAVHIQCCLSQIPYTILNISEWKRHIAGASTASKIQKKKWGKEAAKKLFIQEALWDRYGYRFPNHSISEKTGKPIFFRYDVVDAVAMTVFYLEKYLGVKSISMDVPVPPDVEFKKKPKSYFEY